MISTMIRPATENGGNGGESAETAEEVPGEESPHAPRKGGATQCLTTPVQHNDQPIMRPATALSQPRPYPHLCMLFFTSGRSISGVITWMLPSCPATGGGLYSFRPALCTRPLMQMMFSLE